MTNPVSVFHNKGWVGWEDFLNKIKKGYVSTSSKKKILSYDEAKKWLKKHNPNLSTLDEYKKYKRDKKISFLPHQPDIAYNKRQENWKGLEDFLPNYNTKFSKKNFLNFINAKNWIKKNRPDITWSKYLKEKKENTIPAFLPFHPERLYSKDWKGFNDFVR